MRFSTRQIELFRRQGYLAVPGFYGADEVAALQAEVERFKREGLVRNVATDGDGKTHSTTKANLQLIPLFDKSDLVRALPFDAKVVEAVGRLIGDPFLLHLDQMFLKPARHGAGTAWHQDNAYFKIADPLRGTAMWIAIHDATVANGTLHLIPGSHRERYEHRRDPDSDHHIRAWPPEERAEPIELKPAASPSSATAPPTARAPTPPAANGPAWRSTFCTPTMRAPTWSRANAAGPSSPAPAPPAAARSTGSRLPVPGNGKCTA